MTVTLYRKRLIPDRKGLIVWTEEWVSIHETPCYHYCIPLFEYEIGIRPAEGETKLQAAKRRCNLKRIAKAGSRFAFDSEKKSTRSLAITKEKAVKALGKRDGVCSEVFRK